MCGYKIVFKNALRLVYADLVMHVKISNTARMISGFRNNNI